MNLTDSHTHLDSIEFDDDRDAVIDRALKAGVTRIVTIGAGKGLDSAARAIRLAEHHPFIWATAGVHPHDAGGDATLDKLRDLASHQRVVAIGETGLDFFRDWAPVDRQRWWFEAQIRLALELRKPLVIHSRDAGAECLQTLERLGADAVGGVFHCYSENAAFALALRRINFLVSFPGSITFKKADALRATCRDIPLDQIMVETDAPYMAPEPHRGKRCESSFVVETARQVAGVKGVTLAELAEATTANAMRLFRLT